MQIEAQQFLRLAEKSKTLAFVDIEATGLRGDYNSVLVVSIKPYNSKPITYRIKQAGNDKKVVRDAKECLESFDAWVTFYGKGFDVPMLNTRLLKWGVAPIDKRHHLDLYFTLKSNLLTSRRSQAHLLRFLKTPEQKMDVSPEAWNEILHNPNGKTMRTMVARCESDVAGLEDLYNKTKHIVREIKK